MFNMLKTLITLAAMKWHMYSHGQQLHKCDKCKKSFMYKSKLCQHKCMHVTQKLYQCCFGSCYKKFWHLQDLERHIATHTEVKYECEMCDKSFKQKRLLKQHEVVHGTANRYFCPKCNMGYKHNNQLFRHQKVFNMSCWQLHHAIQKQNILLSPHLESIISHFTCILWCALNSP